MAALAVVLPDVMTPLKFVGTTAGALLAFVFPGVCAPSDCCSTGRGRPAQLVFSAVPAVSGMPARQPACLLGARTAATCSPAGAGMLLIRHERREGRCDAWDVTLRAVGWALIATGAVQGTAGVASLFTG